MMVNYMDLEKEGYVDQHNCPACRKPNLICRRWLAEPDAWCGWCKMAFDFVRSASGRLALVKKTEPPRPVLDRIVGELVTASPNPEGGNYECD